MRDSLVFYLNGQRQEIRCEAALLNLAQWLRERKRMKGTKVVCNEGDCGACSVLVGRRDGDCFDYRPIDSCIAFPFQLDQTHVVTVEGLGQDAELSAVQQAMVDCHGSQCGFCTPGFVATMHGMLEKQSALTEESLRYGLSGNLCRCTGYVQIIDAGKSIVADQVQPLNEVYPPGPILRDFDDLDDEVQIKVNDRVVFVPSTIDQVVAILSDHPNATMVAGATDYGVIRNHGRDEPTDIISLCCVADFDHIKIVDGSLCIGGGATWTDIENFIQQSIPQYHKILIRFGSPQIRNAGTLAGNLAGGSPIGDSIPFHMVMDSQLELTGPDGVRTVKLCDFYTGYRQNVMSSGELITEIITPLPKDDERLSLFKISKRQDMDISTETLGVWVKLDGEKVADARVAIGGVGATVMRITNAEQSLIGATLSEESFRKAGGILRKEILPWSDVRGGDDYRLQLAENLMLKSFYELSQPS